MLGLILVTALSSSTESARAQLQWDAPEGCPTQAEVRELVAERTQQLGSASNRSLHATARSTSAGWVVELRVTTGKQTRVRTLPAQPTCRDAASATALAIAVAFDAPADTTTDGGDAPLPETDEAEAPQPSPDDSPSVLDPYDEPAPATTRRARALPPAPAPARSMRRIFSDPRGFVFAESGVVWNLLPRAGLLVGGGFGVQWYNAVLRTFFSLTPRQDLVLGTAYLETSQWTLGALLGPRWMFPRAGVELEIGSGIESGQLLIQPRNFIDGRPARQAWAALLMAPTLAVSPIDRLALGLRMHLIVPLVHPRYRLGDETVVYEPGWFGLRGTFFIEARFP